MRPPHLVSQGVTVCLPPCCNNFCLVCPHLLAPRPQYLGTFNNEEVAAVAYDHAALCYRGAKAVTNFDQRQYLDTDGTTHCLIWLC